GEVRRRVSCDDLEPLVRALRKARVTIEDTRTQHHARAEFLPQVARGRERFLSPRPVRSEEADLPPACGLDLWHHERATGDEAEIVAFLERPAQRSEQRRALAGRRQHRAFDAQRASTFAVDAQT